MEDAGHAPGDGGAVAARLQPVAAGFDADRAWRRVSMKPAKVPMALLPPPTQATTYSGSAPPRISRHWARASSPTTRWNSRTIHG